MEVDPERRWDKGGEQATHDAIEQTLRASQNRRCAYCECPLRAGGAIEHIHPKSVPDCTTRPSANHDYDWTNLLLVCGSTTHCDGPKAAKDLCGEVLFPDEMDPERRYFEVNTLDGELRVVAGLPSEQSAAGGRAIQELRLNDPALRSLRLEVIEMIQSEMDECGELVARHKATCTQGFATTIDSYFA